MRRSMTMGRAGMLWVLAGCLAMAGACKQESGPAPAGDAAGSQEGTAPTKATPTTPHEAATAQPELGPFELPDVDTSGLPALLRTEIGSALYAARSAPDSATDVAKLGMLCYAHDRLPIALQCFERAAEIEPASFVWPYFVGLTHEKMGALDAAMADYEKAMGMTDKYPALGVHLAQLVYDRDRARAEKLYEEALAQDDGLSQAHFGLGQCAEARNAPDEAIAHYREAVLLRPWFAAAHTRLAALFEAKGETAAARQAARQAAEVASFPEPLDQFLGTMLVGGRDARALASAARVIVQRGDLQLAASRAELAAQIDGECLFVQNTLAMIRGLQGRHEESAELCQKILDKHPEDLLAEAELVKQMILLERYDEAEARLAKILADDPRNLIAIQRQADIARRKGDTDHALELLQATLEWAPQAPALYFQLAELYESQGRHADALEPTRKGLTLAPDDVLRRFHLGYLLQQTGDAAGAQQQWQQCIQLNPGYAPPYNALAETLLGQGDFDGAERLLRQGLEQAPQSAVLTNGLAWLLATSPYGHQRNGVEAVRMAEEACDSTNRQHAPYLDTLAAAYAEAGRFTDAVSAQQDAIDLLQQSNDKSSLAGYEARLAQYQRRQPYRMGG